jgi:hypothetical protein
MRILLLMDGRLADRQKLLYVEFGSILNPARRTWPQVATGHLSGLVMLVVVTLNSTHSPPLPYPVSAAAQLSHFRFTSTVSLSLFEKTPQYHNIILLSYSILVLTSYR